MVGYAGSIPEGYDLDISVARQAEYLAAWLRAQELGPVLVVGHDLGGDWRRSWPSATASCCAG
jgi:pimeloyl-ACP methyl ester carboxylesterase